jgi:hypothetical protein
VLRLKPVHAVQHVRLKQPPRAKGISGLSGGTYSGVSCFEMKAPVLKKLTAPSAAKQSNLAKFFLPKPTLKEKAVHGSACEASAHPVKEDSPPGVLREVNRGAREREEEVVYNFVGKSHIFGPETANFGPNDVRLWHFILFWLVFTSLLRDNLTCRLGERNPVKTLPRLN